MGDKLRLRPYMAELAVNIPNNLADLLQKNSEFHFTYHLPNGNSEIFSVMNSSDLMVEHNYQPEDFPGIDYLLRAEVDFVYEGQVLCSASNLIEVNVIDFGIEYFRDAGTGKDWKVVVGRDIEYKAYGSRHAYDWKWEFTSETGQNELYWNSQKGNKQASNEPGATIMKIPYSDLTTFTGGLRASNIWFGNNTSQIKLSAKNGEGEVYFTEGNTFSGEDIQVFFEPDLSVSGNAPSSDSDPPMWFVFWKEGNVIDGMQEVEYDHNSLPCAYLKSNSGAPPKIYLAPIAPSDICRDAYLIVVGGQEIYVGEALKVHADLVAAIIAHENHHLEIEVNWNDNQLPNHIHDTDETDNIPNGYELNPGVYNALHGSGPIRSYFPPSNPTTTNSFQWPNPGGYGEGREDHEVRCFIEEVENPSTVHYWKEWSFSEFNQNWNN